MLPCLSSDTCPPPPSLLSTQSTMHCPVQPLPFRFLLCVALFASALALVDKSIPHSRSSKSAAGKKSDSSCATWQQVVGYGSIPTIITLTGLWLWYNKYVANSDLTRLTAAREDLAKSSTLLPPRDHLIPSYVWWILIIVAALTLLAVLFWFWQQKDRLWGQGPGASQSQVATPTDVNQPTAQLSLPESNPTATEQVSSTPSPETIPKSVKKKSLSEVKVPDVKPRSEVVNSTELIQPMRSKVLDPPVGSALKSTVSSGLSNLPFKTTDSVPISQTNPASMKSALKSNIGKKQHSKMGGPKKA